MRRSQERIAVVLRRPIAAHPDTESSLGDNHATLEAAVGFARHKPVRITALGVFESSDDKGVCQEALDLGCDAAISITAPVPFDIFGEALLLRAAIDSAETTMVVCGDYDGNFGGASMGAALAFMLDMPCITGVLDCKFKGDDYLVTRRTDMGVDQFRCPRPALFTFLDRLPGSSSKIPREVAPAVVESRDASTLLSDLSVLYSRSSLAVHSAYHARPEAPELLSDPATLLCRLREAKLWDTD